MPSSLLLHVARFTGHMFLVLRVAPTVLDVMRAMVVSMAARDQPRGSAGFLARVVLFTVTVVYTVGMLFVVSTLVMQQSKSIYEVVRAGLSIVFIFEVSTLHLFRKVTLGSAEIAAYVK